MPPSQEEPLAAAKTAELIEEPPPVLGRWVNLYGLLVAQLVVLSLLFYALGRWAS
jgi:hypothetical protein